MSDQNETTANSTLNIRQAAIAMGTSEQYVRQLLITGKVPGEKNEKGVWTVNAEDAAQHSVASKSNAAVAYIVYLTPEEVTRVQAALPMVRLEKRFDSTKAKAYRARKSQNEEAAASE